MGKKVEKSLKGDKNPSAVSQDEEDPNKTPGLSCSHHRELVREFVITKRS